MTDILAIGSHPDDIEFACGAILAKMASQGKSIVMADLTRGEMGSSGDPETRQKESVAAAAVIGARRVFLDFKDCQIADSHEGRLKIVKLIREVKPKLVIAPMWKGEQNHPDHIATGLMARYACRFSRFCKILPELPIHWVDGILHYPPPSYENLDFLVDVSDFVKPWVEMMRCHKTQMKTFPYDQWNQRLASKLGMLMGCDYAQGLVKGNPIVIEDLMDVSKGAREI